jgi:uncharacterized heparinase superfamily protein
MARAARPSATYQVGLMPDGVAGKLRRFGRQLIYRNPVYTSLLDNGVPSHLARQPRDVFAGDATLGMQWLRGKCVLAGRDYALAIESGKIANWCGALAPLAFNELHGFRWLRHLHAVGGNNARQAARQLIEDWLGQFSDWHEAAWQLPVLAERITGWLSQYGFYGAAADDVFRQQWYAGFWRQLRHLERLYLQQTHGLDRLRALKALLFSSQALGENYLPMGGLVTELQEWLANNILPDGCALCRGPGGQAQILSDLLEIRGLFTSANQTMPDGLAEAIAATARALRHMRHGDGGLALFHGSFEDRAEWLDLLLITANQKGRPGDALEDGGWQRLQAGRSLLLLDAGLNRCPHSVYHSSPLAMEFSVGRERIIVNCGSGAALNAAWLVAGRSLAAHSALELPQLPEPSPSEWIIERKTGEGQVWLETGHNGWREWGIHHRRQLFLSADGDDLRGEDSLSNLGGVFAPQPFALRLHLHPKIQCSQAANSVLLRTPSGAGWRIRVSGAEMALEPSVYLGQMGQLQRTQQVVLRGELLGSEACVRWALQKEGKKS